MKKLLVILAFLITSCAAYVISSGLRDVIPEKADVIVVFGNTVNSDGTLSLRLQTRMDRAIELIQANHAPYMIVSGAVATRIETKKIRIR